MDLNNKSNRKFFLLVKKMRKQQNLFSLYKERKALNEAKRLERELDKMLIAIEKLAGNAGIQLETKEAQPPKNLF